MTAYGGGRARPSPSSLNFRAGQAIANEVTVPVADGKVDLGAVDLHVTPTQENGSGYLEVYPSATKVPNNSSIDYVRGVSVSNHVLLGTGSSSQMSF